MGFSATDGTIVLQARFLLVRPYSNSLFDGASNSLFDGGRIVMSESAVALEISLSREK